MVRAFAAALLAAVLTACAGGPVRDVTDPELPRALPEAGPVPYYSHIAPDRTLPPRSDPR